jgi:hypothetical protein
MLDVQADQTGVPMAMTAPPEPVDFDAVPGVDLVAGAATAELEAQLLTDRVLTAAATVHRRFLDRRGTLLRSRMASEPAPAPAADWTTIVDQRLELLRGPDLCIADGASWAGRLQAYRTLATPTEEAGVPVVRVRGWDRTDAAVLVDGRGISGCILDLAVALELRAREFEAGEQPLAVCIPDVRTAGEARVWATMLGRVQDRLGIPRDSVPVIVTIESEAGIRDASGILAEFRNNCVGLCIAEGLDLDEVRAKEAADRHGIRWIGAIPSSLDLL